MVRLSAPSLNRAARPPEILSCRETPARTLPSRPSGIREKRRPGDRMQLPVRAGSGGLLPAAALPKPAPAGPGKGRGQPRGGPEIPPGSSSQPECERASESYEYLLTKERFHPHHAKLTDSPGADRRPDYRREPDSRPFRRYPFGFQNRRRYSGRHFGDPAGRRFPAWRDG